MDLLKQLYCISSPSGKEKQMRKTIKRLCESYGATTETDSKGNLYVTKGNSDSYPCVVAHMDEVCPDRGKGYRVIEQNGAIFGFDFHKKSFSGIGGDDKNGIWVALKCIQKYDVIKCAFFVEEEIGCGGSSQADIFFFADCRFVLQCDRRGAHDLITEISLTELCSEEFLSVINYETFGYKPTSGMLTDVITLKEKGVNLSCLNISCGYYQPHSDEEYTIFSDLENCLAFVQNIIENCTDVYPHEYTGYDYSDYRWSGYNYGGKSYGSCYNSQYDDKFYGYNNEYDEMCDYLDNIDLTEYNEKDLQDLVRELAAGFLSVSYDEIVDCVDWCYHEQMDEAFEKATKLS